MNNHGRCQHRVPKGIVKGAEDGLKIPAGFSKQRFTDIFETTLNLDAKFNTIIPFYPYSRIVMVM